MYHTCSDGYCLVDGKCGKRFPKPWSHFNVVEEKSYPHYRRRPPFPILPTEADSAADPNYWGNSFSRTEKKVTRILDNRYVVPHNRALLLDFGSHINVEWLQGDGTLSYVLKYVLKGSDMAYVQVTEKKRKGLVDIDEFKEMQLGRYTTATEAFLKLWSNSIVERSVQVDTLWIHLPGQIELIYEDGFEEEAAEEEIDRQNRGIEKKSMLTEYFRVCREEGFKGRYDEIASKYRWDQPAKTWKRWKTKRPRNKLIRIGPAQPGNIEAQVLKFK
jgi:hypothetical protein